MKNNKKLIIIGTIFIAIILMVTLGFALFTAREEETAKINIGNIEVVLEEDWPDDVPEIGIEQYQKNVCGRSVGDSQAYVRMRFIPVVEYYYEEENESGEKTGGEWITAPVPQENIRITVSNDDNWVLQGDYYYYKKILDPGETTEQLNLKWEIYEVPSDIVKYEKIRTDVRVILEYSQVSNDMWKEIFQIEDLPEGVER